MELQHIHMDHDSISQLIRSMETVVDHFRPSRDFDPYGFKGNDRMYIRQFFEVSANASNENMMFSKEGDPIEAVHSVKFQMEYMVRSFGRSVRVRWRPIHIIRHSIDPDTNLRDVSKEVREFYGTKEPWREIGDHDSCWRDCSSNVKKWIRENFESVQTFDHVYTHYTTDYFHILHQIDD